MRILSQNIGIFALLSILIFLIFGCVSTHYGREYQFAEKQLIVSCGKDYGIRHSQIKSITCAFENTGASWITVKTGSVSPLSAVDNSKQLVLSPDQVQKFIQAYRFQAEKDEYNSNLLLTGLVIGGLAASTASNSNVATAGATTAVISTLAGAAGEAAVSHTKALNGGILYGESHVLGPEFEIPPKSFVRKIILVDSMSDGRSVAWPKDIELCLEKPEKSCTLMSFWNARMED